MGCGISCELLVIVSGTTLRNFELGVQANRIQELAGSYFLAAIPFLVETVVPPQPRLARANRLVLSVAVVGCAAFTVIAFVEPALFVSVTQRHPQWESSFADWARGALGPLITVRDLLLGPFALYLLVLSVVDAFRAGRYVDHFLIILGTASALFFALSDVLHHNLGVHIGYVEHTPFALVPVGITLFVAMAMAAVFTRFVRQSEELAQANVTFEASRRMVVRVQDATVFALAYQAELRDNTTGEHLERTSKYVEILADQVHLDPRYAEHVTADYVRDVTRASPLHDVGKVGVPDAILLKPGKLDDEELEVMRGHCELGAKVLRVARERIGFESFYELAISIALAHHEKWDGSGYPAGLAGVDIPLSARIMAIADVYDALRSDPCIVCRALLERLSGGLRALDG